VGGIIQDQQLVKMATFQEKQKQEESSDYTCWPPQPGCLPACFSSADSSKCTSAGNDCNACDASIGMTKCGFTEPATCKDGYTPAKTEIKEESWAYTCLPPQPGCTPSDECVTGDDSKCTSIANDCNACDVAIGMTECQLKEAATCKDGYIPKKTGVHFMAYTCLPPKCAEASSQNKETSGVVEMGACAMTPFMLAAWAMQL